MIRILPFTLIIVAIRASSIRQRVFQLGEVIVSGSALYSVRGILVAAFVTLVVGSTFSQTPQSSVTVEGEVLKPLRLTLKDLEKYPATEVKAEDRDGKTHTYKGTLLFVVLDSAGVTLGKQLRGANLVKYVLLTAADDYQVIYSLPEIDPEFTSNTVLLATHVDGKLLPKGEGPFRLVNPADKKPARWIREISSIKIVFSKQ